LYEFHGWITLAETPYDVDVGKYNEKFDALCNYVDKLDWSSCKIDLLELNGRNILILNGYPNRRRSEANELAQLISYVAKNFTGAYGLIYELDEQTETVSGRGVFSVTVVRRGQCLPSLDPFLSPAIPVIEDL
jgi:hypothetical protein